MLYKRAAPVPMAIKVNMLRLLLIIDCHPRTKNGKPAQATTGVPRIISIHFATVAEDQLPTVGIHSFTGKPTNGPMAIIRTGIVSTSPIQNLREKSTSSGSGPASGSGKPFGSRAMPHFGQLPGPICSISGCIGQVYTAFTSTGPTGVEGV